jgi:hypothetical protein
MLTRKELELLKAMLVTPLNASANKALQQLFAELENYRPIVLAALQCTGEDGHDGVAKLNEKAEDYLDQLKDRDEWEQSKSDQDMIRQFIAEDQAWKKYNA